jgi:hypothetical protein
MVQAPEPQVILDTSSDSWDEPTETQYLIHDNGGRPYLVRVEGPSHVTVYQQEDQDDGDTVTYSRIHSFDQLRHIWIPDDDEESTFRGNNILLETNTPQEYILISSSISTFHSKAPIVTFSSNVGNNDVPYPHAVDADGRYYILWDSVLLDSVPPEHQRDPTRYWVKQHRNASSLRVGSSNDTWYFVLNTDPESDAEQWHAIQRRASKRKAEDARHDNFMRILKERGVCDPEQGIPVEEYFAVCALFPEEPLSAYQPDDVFVQNHANEWELIDFAKYKELQDEWRARLQCSPLLLVEMTATPVS